MERLNLGAALKQLATEYLHTQSEHRREGREGTWRRRLQARMTELEREFEALLARWVTDDELRRQWREHFHGHRAEPAAPALREPPVYKGRAESGSVIAVFGGDDGGYEAFVDGALALRLATPVLAPDFAERLGLRGQALTELFDADAEAEATLDRHVADPSGPPPWEWARELYEDGLIDPDFGLTTRGHRLIELRRAGIMPR
jgi:hypothetical protein